MWLELILFAGENAKRYYKIKKNSDIFFQLSAPAIFDGETGNLVVFCWRFEPKFLLN